MPEGVTLTSNESHKSSPVYNTRYNPCSARSREGYSRIRYTTFFPSLFPSIPRPVGYNTQRSGLSIHIPTKGKNWLVVSPSIAPPFGAAPPALLMQMLFFHRSLYQARHPRLAIRRRRDAARGKRLSSASFSPRQIHTHTYIYTRIRSLYIRSSSRAVHIHLGRVITHNSKGISFRRRPSGSLFTFPIERIRYPMTRRRGLYARCREPAILLPGPSCPMTLARPAGRSSGIRPVRVFLPFYLHKRRLLSCTMFLSISLSCPSLLYEQTVTLKLRE